jgi:hypothetical protein
MVVRTRRRLKPLEIVSAVAKILAGSSEPHLISILREDAKAELYFLRIEYEVW